jgi:hypothetical protein
MKKLLILFLISLSAYGQESIQFKTKESLKNEIIRAINANDKLAYIDTFHPVFRKRLTKNNSVIFNDVVEKQLSFTVQNKYEAVFHEINPEDTARYLNGSSRFPVVPNYKLRINFNESEYSQASTFMWLSHDDYGWYQVMGIPTNERLAKFIESRKKYSLFQERISKYVDTMDGSLYQKIVDILRDEKNIINANKYHMKETGSNMNVSIHAVKLIKEREGIKW